MTTQQYTGWVLDLFATPRDGLAIWFISEDGQRLRFTRPYPLTFYAAGEPTILHQLEIFLDARPGLHMVHTHRRDLFVTDPVEVLAIEVLDAFSQPVVFQQAERRFPDITYYDADIPISIRAQAEWGIFPLAYCVIAADEGNVIQSITPLDTPWDVDTLPVPLRILSIEPDVNPSHAAPSFVQLRYENRTGRLQLQPERPFLINLVSILNSYDPDLLLTNWGDTWLIDYLVKLSLKWKIPLPINREPGRGVQHKRERVYFSYGQVIHRGNQVHLFGRLHIDRANAMMWGDYGLEGVYELGRVTGLPLQVAARVSPGTGISSMQMTTALHMQVMVPWHKQQVEDSRTALSLFYGDQGGLVYQPTVGLHRDVGEVDFVSMYPSVMVHFNISPETIGRHIPESELVPQLNMYIDQTHMGLVPLTLAPLLGKRVAMKSAILTLPSWDPRVKRYKMCSQAHKWLLVTCFGYLGYKNARFGRIEAHQAVTAYGREILLMAKEAAEDQGFEVLHMYVDGLWVRKPGAKTVADFQPALDDINERTGLPIALDGVYRWVAFLPSKRDERIPVPNRYFGVFQDGSIKIRGIDARRGDTPACVADAQLEALHLLAHARDVDEIPALLPGLRNLLNRRLHEITSTSLPLERYLITLKLSRTLDEYKSDRTPTAAALTQLQAVGKSLRPGQRVRFVYVLGKAPGVYAWDLPDPIDPRQLDTGRYRVLFMRAVATILQPLGVADTEEKAAEWLRGEKPADELPLQSAIFNPAAILPVEVGEF
jgi:DNA polymerase II